IGVQGEVESEGPSESECQPYIEKALKELEATGAVGEKDSSTEAGDDNGGESASLEQEGGEGSDETEQIRTTDAEKTQEDQMAEIPSPEPPKRNMSVIQKLTIMISGFFQKPAAKEEKLSREERSTYEKEPSRETADSGEKVASEEEGDSKEKQLEEGDSKEEHHEEEGESKEEQHEEGDSKEEELGEEAIKEGEEESGEDTAEGMQSQEQESKEDVGEAEMQEASEEQPSEADGSEETTDQASVEDLAGQQQSEEAADESPEQNIQEEEEEHGSPEVETIETREALETVEVTSVEETESKEADQPVSEEAQESAEKEESKEDEQQPEDEASVEVEQLESKETDGESTEKEDSKVEEEESKEETAEEEQEEEKQESEALQSEEGDSKESEPIVAEQEEKSEEGEHESKEDEETTGVKSEENDTQETESKETGAGESHENLDEPEADSKSESKKEEITESEEKSEEQESSDEKTEEVVVEDLTIDVEVPSDLRPREHVEQLLKLDDHSSETEEIVNHISEVTLRELKKLYENAIKPLEVLYKYRDLSNRHFGDAEIFSKPLVLFMGPWSGGKSSIINYLVNNEYNETSLRTGAEPSPAYFNILMYGEEPEILDGTELMADYTFSGLQKFGQGLEERLRGVKLPAKLLEKVNIVEIPGILEVRKQVSRLFPFNDACQWFIDRSDIIFLVYDPSKLDVGPETEAILDQLKGREHQTRIVLNKADQVKPEELMRVQGSLIWNISPLMSSPQPPVMYTVSLWSRPYESWAPVRLLQAQERAFLRDLRGAIDKRIENKIASARRFAVRVRNHAKMVDCYLTTYYNHKSVFGNRKQVAEEIIEHPQNYHIYEGLSTLTNISRYDLPDPDVYRDFFRLNALYEFQQLSATCTYFRGCPINRLDVAIAYDLPELVGTHKKMVENALAKTGNDSNSGQGS
ncbi:unnamed protein product, partial [Callosobruchus maculatus]